MAKAKPARPAAGAKVASGGARPDQIAVSNASRRGDFFPLPARVVVVSLVLLPLLALLLPLLFPQLRLWGADAPLYPLDLASQPYQYRWGTLRPNVYFGVKARVAASPLLGMLWYDGDNVESIQNSMRHDCDERDGLSRYGWRMHNGRTFGLQELSDPKLGVSFTTQFVQVPLSPTSSSDHSQAHLHHDEVLRQRLRNRGRAVPETWVAQITASSTRSEQTPRNISLLWYVALQDPQHQATLLSLGVPSDNHDTQRASLRSNRRGLEGAVDMLVRTASPHLGDVRISSSLLPPLSASSAPSRTFYQGFRVPANDAWQVKSLTQKALVQDYGKQINKIMRVLLSYPALVTHRPH